MGTYGSFETLRELGAGHGTVVYQARKQGPVEDDQYAVKVFSLEPLIGEDREVKTDLESLLGDLGGAFGNAVELQRKAANAAPGRFAPILESGRNEKESWYATRLYPRSVQKIIQGRVALTKVALLHILDSVLPGLQTLKRMAGRCHGNLKPSNILVGGGTKITDAEVVLADPLPGARQEASRYEVADLRNIGLLIYQIVRRREVAEGTDWLMLPLELTQEWKSLFGKDAAEWLRLCNTLLDPNLSLAVYDVDKLEGDLARLRPKPPVSSRALALAAGVVFLGGIAVVLVVWRGRFGTLRLQADPPLAVVAVTNINGEIIFGPKPLPGARQRVRLRAGEYGVTATYGDLDAFRTNVTVRGRTTVDLPLRLPYGGVRIASNPGGARVKDQDGKLVAGPDRTTPVKTPVVIPFLRPGPVRYEIDLDDGKHDLALVPGVVEAGQTNDLGVVELRERQPDEVLVTFVVTPLGMVLTDSQGREVPPRASLAPGRHTYYIRHRTWPWPTKRWDFEVKPGETAQTVTIHYPNAEINLTCTDPENARVYVGTNQVGTTPASLSWAEGPVEFRFEAEGYDATNVPVNIKFGADVALQVRLPARQGYLQISSTPAPALILTNGVAAGQTSSNAVLHLALKEGTYPVTAQYPWLSDRTQKVEIKSGQTNQWQVVFDFGIAQLASDPPGAEFYWFSSTGWVALTPRVILPSGSNTLRARHRTYPMLTNYATNVTVANRVVGRHTLYFDYGTVVVTSTPPGAAVSWVNPVSGEREELGNTPITNLVAVGPVAYDLVFDQQYAVLQTNVRFLTTHYLGHPFRVLPPPTNVLGIEFVWVPDLPNTTEGGWVGRCEVTQGQFERWMTNNPSQHKGSTNLPVENVTWAEAVEFCRRLNNAPRPDPNLYFTLPTIDQWKHFALVSNPNEEVLEASQPVAYEPGNSRGRNQFGLWHTLGNVQELSLEAHPSRTPARLGFNYRDRMNSPPAYQVRTGGVWDQARHVAVGFRVLYLPLSAIPHANLFRASNLHNDLTNAAPQTVR